ncbi:hypothetical protein NLU13_5153 [Sarocladium strictum]|uniref:Uncharacterized protein n=1 Tax=Sarocladium strictum TaxID=5046 RepID=A0AA39L7I4_SARSR|nr:hypothetical protein NLU13_5153 [Sarocladium strictum]
MQGESWMATTVSFGWRTWWSTDSSSSSPADKPGRRGATPGPHILRAGGPTSNAKRSSQTSSNMPAPPPKAAMPSTAANLSSPEEALESANTAGHGGSAPPKDKNERDKDGNRSDARSKDAVPASNAGDALLLRERDDRIASLEKELAVMEREFTRELDKLSRRESETATFWQAKHSALHQQFLRADTDLRLLRTDAEAREREREELRNSWEMLRRTLAERDGEARALKAQVRGLKEFVSTSTRTDGQQSATDESLAEAMARLGNGLQNWELSDAIRAEAGESLPMFDELVANGSKVHLLQSMVSKVLVDDVFGAYYAGLSREQTAHLRDTEQMLSSFAASEEAIPQWRASTLALIHRDAATHLHGETASLIDTLASRILRVLDSILQPSSTAPTAPDPRESTLRQLLASAIDLSRLLAVQRAVFGVHMPPIMPHQRVLFDHATMEDVGGEEEEALVEREISCIVFPGLIKQGDESGGHLNVYRNVITKARVSCASEG